MRKNKKRSYISEDTENLITGFMLLSVGIICSTLEYCFRAPLFPNLLNLIYNPVGLSNPVRWAYNKLYGIQEFESSSAWYLFIMLGIIIFVQAITKYKTKYKLKTYILILYYLIDSKLYDGRIEVIKWKASLKN